MSKEQFRKSVRTEKFVSEEAIEAYKKRFQAMDISLDPGPSMYFLLNHNTLIYEYLSGSVDQIMGYSIEEFQKLDDPYLKFFHEDDLPIFMEHIFPAFKEIRVKNKDRIPNIYYQILGRIQQRDGGDLHTLLEYHILELDSENRPIISFGKLTEVGMPSSVKGIVVSVFDSEAGPKHLLFKKIYPYEQTAISRREMEVLELIANGKTAKQIAEILFISENTVKNHRQNLLKKLKLKSSRELVRYAIETGLTS